MTTAPLARGKRRPARAALVALVAATAVGVVPGLPADATDRRSEVLPAAARLPTQAGAGDPNAGPYDPGFIDEPIAANPPSPALDDVPIASSELDQVEGLLTGAERRRDQAIADRDDLRRQIVELGDQRVEAVAALEQRRQEEVAAGQARQSAVNEHDRRADLADEALAQLRVAQGALRDLMAAAYVNAASSISDKIDLLNREANISDSLLRLGYSGTSVEGRSADVRARAADRRGAVAAEDRALRARQAAEQAERDAVAAREAAEQRIVDIDAETARAQADERDAVEALAAREADVLIAGLAIAPARLRSDITVTGIDFPLVALDAWVKASAEAPCRIEWWALAGISKIEGRHGTHGGGRLGARGYPSVKIIGPVLNGTNGNAAIRDTDGGLYDQDVVWDRAVGPMQFIPSTWRAWGRDGDRSGFADPFTIYDASAAAAAYLCYGRSDLTDEAQLRAGYLSYNRSSSYVEAVLRAAYGYRAALAVPPHVPVVDPTLPPLVPGSG